MPTDQQDLDGRTVSVGATPAGVSIELDVSDAGPRDGEVVLLVAGLGMQRIGWPAELRAGLHDAGYRTVAVDNRDCGRSTVLPGSVADLPRGDDGWPVAAYPLAALARDLVAVLRRLDIDRAHVVGLSMGGMIAQHLAIAHPDRVASLTSVMSTTGAPGVGQPHRDARFVLTTPSPTERDAYLDHAVVVAGAVGSPGYLDEGRVRARAALAYARGVHPQGTARQLLAIRADGDRTEALRGVRAPTLVVHGTHDPLIDVSGGHATAEAIPGATLHLVEGMGHDLPLPLLPTVIDAIVEHVRAQPFGRPG